MTSTVEQVKARLAIVEVVGGYLKLERAGASWRARCPFHQEKTPSFFVSPGRGTWHCFGCNRGGDLISFVQEIENLDFVGTLKLLAERAGVEFQVPNRALASLKDRLYLLHEAANRHYTEQLSKSPAVLDYLTTRGLTAETIKSFRLGFAPAGWRNIGPILDRQNFKEAESIAAGLLVAPTASHREAYDRFRQRIMFPLFDSVGRIVGFSGRIFGDDDKQAKYLNSPDTPLYDKSKLLYLYDRARLALRTADRCILVEGQMDALLSHQIGLVETVAVSGTALSPDHLTLIKRLTNNLIMAFDADLAGIKAGQRAIELALAAGFEVKIAVLPNDNDPADLIKTDPEQWRRAVAEAVHIIDFMLTVLQRPRPGKSEATGLADQRALAHAIEREVYPFIVRLANPLDQAFFINQIAVLLGLSDQVIKAGVEKVKINPARTESAPATETSAPPPARTRRERLEEMIFGLTVWRAELAPPARVHLGSEKFDQLNAALTARRDELTLAAEVAYGRANNFNEELNELLAYWQTEVWREELAVLLAKLKQLQSAPPAVVTPLLARCQNLSQKINNLKKL